VEVMSSGRLNIAAV